MHVVPGAEGVPQRQTCCYPVIVMMIAWVPGCVQRHGGHVQTGLLAPWHFFSGIHAREWVMEFRPVWVCSL